MGKYHDAADALKRQAAKYESLMAAAKVLDEVGSIEQAVMDLRKEEDRQRNENAALRGEATKAKKDLASAKQQADEMIARANDQALARLQEADQKAQAILDGATVDAAKTLAQAQADADRVQGALAGKVASLTSTKVALEQDVASLTRAVDAKRGEADDLDKRLAKIQAQIAKMMA